MGSYIKQREKYQKKALQLYSTGLGANKISKLMPVSRDTIRHWIDKFVEEQKEISKKNEN